MSILALFDEKGNLEYIEKNYDEIAKSLKNLGVRFERWETPYPLSYDADQEEVIEAYQKYIDSINKEFNFKSLDVVSISQNHPKKEELRILFTKEHIHSDFEVRFFVDGSGTFYIHVGDKVYVVLCEKGDFISVPANTKHWYDMGSQPFFKAIRFFSIEDGWVANFTEDNIPNVIPDHDKIITL